MGDNNDGKCLECGEPLTGRCDKKFCCDYCRNSYNNRLRKDDSRIRVEVNRALGRNRRILLSIPKGGRMNLREAVCKGFDLSRMTGRRGIVYECYDVKYTVLFGYLRVLRKK